MNKIFLLIIILSLYSCYVVDVKQFDEYGNISYIQAEVSTPLVKGVITAIDNPSSTSNGMLIRNKKIQNSIFNGIVQSDENNEGAVEYMRKYQKTYNGWWVYGEGQHIFKDEQSLEEYDLIFPNENMEELVELYVSVCEMEYFPMECEMTGILSGSILSVQEFEILYIQGCGE